jgi:hypothetical protein
MLHGVPRPDHGEGWVEMVCPRCKASWVGHVTDGDGWCPWCDRRAELAREMERRELLEPPWSHSDHGAERYDALTDVQKAVWDRTRGQVRGTDTVIWWVARLGRACADGLITRDEMTTAIRKVTG